MQILNAHISFFLCASELLVGIAKCEHFSERSGDGGHGRARIPSGRIFPIVLRGPLKTINLESIFIYF